MAKSKWTHEGKIAIKMIELLNDYDIDLDDIGMYIAQVSSSTMYNRLETVMDSAREHKEYDYANSRERHEEYIQRLGN